MPEKIYKARKNARIVRQHTALRNITTLNTSIIHITKEIANLHALSLHQTAKRIISSRHFNMAVSTLDYSHFTSGTEEQRGNFARALLNSFERTGFAKLTGHTFSAQELETLFTGVGPTPTSIQLVIVAILTFFARAKSFLISLWR